jgi:hypothetical protein
MGKRFDLGDSPEDRATYAAWRRGVIIFYCFIALVVVAAIAAVHSPAADRLAGN